MDLKYANTDQPVDNDEPFDKIVNQYIIVDRFDNVLSPLLSEGNDQESDIENISFTEITSSYSSYFNDVKDVKIPITEISSTNSTNTEVNSMQKKRKKHEIEDPFSDEEEEVKRQNAIKAKSNRDRKRSVEMQRTEELFSIKKEKDHLLLEKMLWEKESVAWHEKEGKWNEEKKELNKRLDALVNIIQNLSKQKA